MAICEVCEQPAEKTCGYEDQPMIDFCLKHYIDHIGSAHPKSEAAQEEFRSLKLKQLGIAEQDVYETRQNGAGLGD